MKFILLAAEQNRKSGLIKDNKWTSALYEHVRPSGSWFSPNTTSWFILNPTGPSERDWSILRTLKVFWVRVEKSSPMIMGWEPFLETVHLSYPSELRHIVSHIKEMTPWTWAWSWRATILPVSHGIIFRSKLRLLDNQRGPSMDKVAIALETQLEHGASFIFLLFL